jgi:hypothetical protein
VRVPFSHLLCRTHVKLLELEFWERRERLWEKLMRGDTLFQELRQLVIAREPWPSKLMTWVEECREFAQSERQEWQIAKTLAWCAEQAKNYPDFYRTEVDHVCFAIGGLPTFIEHDKTWAWGCIRNFIDTPPWKPSVRVPNDLNPIPAVSGRSASAAAALGWYHALNGTIPDDRVIVFSTDQQPRRISASG